MLKIYPEILNKKRQEIFTQLSAFKKIGYLAGGTALALQIKHRQSFDFDVFVAKPINNALRLKTKATFGTNRFYINNEDELSFAAQNEVNITFLWYYFKPLFPLVKTDSIDLASVKDVAADKAHTLGRRAAWRDYVDFFFLLKDKFISLEEVIGLAERKFGEEFNAGLFLQQLSYFADLKETPIEFLQEKYPASEVKRFLEHKVASYVEKIKKPLIYR